MAENKYPTAFPLKHQRKDLELALKYAKANEQELPVAAASTELYKKVRNACCNTVMSVPFCAEVKRKEGWGGGKGGDLNLSLVFFGREPGQKHLALLLDEAQGLNTGCRLRQMDSETRISAQSWKPWSRVEIFPKETDNQVTEGVLKADGNWT